jgi:addiction module HigA family antidote
MAPARVSLTSVSMINGGFASSGQKGPLVQQMLKSLIITEETQMARTAIHHGEHLADELKELNMSAAELARQIDVPVNRVTGIINAQRSVTADTALRLGHWFGTSPDFWLNLQMLYELRLAQREIGKRVENPTPAGTLSQGRSAGSGSISLDNFLPAVWRDSAT